MPGAFQSNAFQNSAFQTGAAVAAPSTPARGTAAWLFGPPQRRTKEQIRADRERFGISEKAAEAIDEALQKAAREARDAAELAERLQEELRAELELRSVAYRAKYLEALNARMAEELALLVRNRKDAEAILILFMLTAAAIQ